MLLAHLTRPDGAGRLSYALPVTLILLPMQHAAPVHLAVFDETDQQRLSMDCDFHVQSGGVTQNIILLKRFYC